MTTALTPLADQAMIHGADFERFFGIRDAKTIRNEFEQREQPALGVPRDSCKTNLFFGFFFDGTKNSYRAAEKSNSHSNVARLYDCFPGQSVPGVLPGSTEWQYDPTQYQHFFRVYAPGVGTTFPQVNDSGDGWQRTAGAASGALGERRIIWALVQAINNVHRFFYKAPLVEQPEMDSLLSRVILNKYALAVMAGEGERVGAEAQRATNKIAAQEFEKVLSKLHAAVKLHWPDQRTGRPPKVDPGIVKTIYVSVFGFSRGATQARAFTNWFLALCKLDARLRGKQGHLSLGGFPVEFDFLGVFDTVASVGLANSSRFFHGHGAWADSEESLRIPAGVKCLHLVSAHEVRRSFPLDSIATAGGLPDGCSEIVVPGVHSDFGGGYCPREQGRGVDPNGDDMMSRIPLLMMYKAARLSGVPLKLELAAPAAKARFAVKTETIKAFNAYIATCKQTKGPLHHIMREQARNYIEWRLARRIKSQDPMQKSASFARASTYDQNDLHSGSLEFEQEIAAFEKWLGEKGRGFHPASQQAGFGDDHMAEWEEIATWWKKGPALSQEVLHFFDEYVHDSRAWFKLTGPDNDEEMHKLLKGWVEKRRIARERDELQAKQRMPFLIGKSDFRVVPAKDGLSDEERRAAGEYERTGKIPRMFVGGREQFLLMGGGYLRYRKVYGGGDSLLLSSTGSPLPGGPAYA